MASYIWKSTKAQLKVFYERSGKIVFIQNPNTVIIAKGNIFEGVIALE